MNFNPKLASRIYFITSLFIGPAILNYGLGRGYVGMDCSDSTWLYVSESVRNDYYTKAADIMSVGSIVMLAVGSLLLFLILKNKRTAGIWVPIFLVGSVMVGYALIVASAGTGKC